ncbi:MAG: AAA family ATPase, partial [Candidatus Aminicenantes bacterium]|nr:AAA family ATPase [Candidatus Aminicenantes bacterium]
IIAGANGVGKTTFARSYSDRYPLEFVNADEAARELNPGDMNSVKLKAGRFFFKKVGELLKTDDNFIIESTLAGKYLLKLIQAARDKNFFVQIIYIFLENPDTCIERIKERVLKGGHNVPDKDVIRRYHRSKKNFWTLYKNLADKWFIMYNSEFHFTEVAIGSKNEYIIRHQRLFDDFTRDIKKVTL